MGSPAQTEGVRELGFSCPVLRRPGCTEAEASAPSPAGHFPQALFDPHHSLSILFSRGADQAPEAQATAPGLAQSKGALCPCPDLSANKAYFFKATFPGRILCTIKVLCVQPDTFGRARVVRWPLTRSETEHLQHIRERQELPLPSDPPSPPWPQAFTPDWFCLV